MKFLLYPVPPAMYSRENDNEHLIIKYEINIFESVEVFEIHGSRFSNACLPIIDGTDKMRRV